MPDQPSPHDRSTASQDPLAGGATVVAAASGERGMGERAGDLIGPYKLQSVIGEGGFGVVWLAERREPMVQRVALKIIKPGMDSKSVLARFEQERQALAVMDHPNVARVLDGGVTPAGRPYFVMEYVKGDPITTFADRRKLTLRERLELFIPVCEAVQHAHMKGLIHRDIKPSNILVAPASEGSGSVVKVIDFGVAKAISQTLTDKTIFTERGQIIGTPEYMSPEQADMGATDIDTRADVYSLGVVLYELLSGTLPFDSTSLRSAGYAEIQRIIREVDPPRPSTKLSTADDKIGVAIALARHAEREKIAGELRRELEWIPMKALRKDRLRRYASAESLGADVRRYLEGKPLEAAPESRAYLVRKFMARNRAPVMAAAAVALALVAGVVTTSLALRRALQAERGVRVQLAETDKAQRAEKQRADQLKQVSDFQSQMLDQINTTKAGTDLMRDVKERFAAALESSGVQSDDRAAQSQKLGEFLARVNATDTAAAMIDRTILRPAVEAINRKFKDQPTIDASLRQTLSTLYYLMGLYDAALPLQESALETRRKVLGEEHPDTLASTYGKGLLLSGLGRFEEAERLVREALPKLQRVLGEDHPDTLNAFNLLGGLLQSRGRLSEAEPYLRESLERHRRVLGEDHANTLNAINTLGQLLQSQGKLAQAEPYMREVVEKCRRLRGEDHPDTLTAMNNLGIVLSYQGKLAEAEPLYRDALERRRRVLGEEHPGTLVSINSMGQLLQAQSRFAESEKYFREAIEKFRRVMGNDHPNSLTVIGNLGFVLEQQGKFAEAEPYLREALEGRRRTLGEDHPGTLDSILYMGHLFQDQGKHAEAEPYFRELFEKSRRVLGPEHIETLTTVQSLCISLRQLGKLREAVDLLAAAEPAARKVFVGDNARKLGAFLKSLGLARSALGYDADRFAVAESNLLEAHSIYVPTRGERHKATIECVQGLVDLYAAWDKAAPGKGYDAKANEWRVKLDPAKGEPK